MVDELIVGDGCWVDGKHVIKATGGWLVVEGPERGLYMQVPDDYNCFPDNETWVRRIENAVDHYSDEEYYEKRIFGAMFIVYKGKAWLNGVKVWDIRDDNAVNWPKEAVECSSVDRFIRNVAIGEVPVEKQIGYSAFAAATKIESTLMDREAGRWEFLRLWDNWEESDVGFRLIRYADMLNPEKAEEFGVLSREQFGALQRQAQKQLNEGLNNSETEEHLRSIIKGHVPFGWRVA